MIPAPDAPWVQCFILDVSENGIRLDVGGLYVPEIFGIAFNADGKVMRLCQIAWRRGERIDARFVTARQLRLGQQPYCDPRLQSRVVRPARFASATHAVKQASRQKRCK